ncbi:M48 family metalloprotease [Achromobacter sp. GG226]|uniref:M48 family metalloprotease n=1 Tax=Verticiella alkaliphila TaxID=2779529 RepID=UPI001C0AE8AE|nr:M48 family metalloprotease [Verticiella sp. GG226]MBU4611267.1 M48 family metalloprotease [Verticiella sp. GG226]
MPTFAPASLRARRIVATCLLPLACLTLPSVHAQPAGLPELGDSAAVDLSPRVERRLGEAIMADGRRDPTYIDDPAIRQYLTDMGRDMARHTAGAPAVEVFAIRDPGINAFALPGGFIGLHSGLVVATQSESELAGVLAHEIAHVSQRHVARQIGQQGRNSLLMLGMMAAALAAAASGAGDLAQGAAVFGQAAVVSQQLAFSRDAEREADRIGLEMMGKAGFDPAGMSAMFGRLMQNTRFNTGAGPTYASTHPLSLDRMSDMQNRAREVAARPQRESPTFWFVRARLAVAQSGYSRASDPVSVLRAEASANPGVRAAAAHYGIAVAMLQRNDPVGARAAWRDAMSQGVQHPMLAQLETDLDIAQGDFAGAVAHSAKAFSTWPQQRSLALSHARALQRAGQDAQAVRFLDERIKAWPESEPELYRLSAESYARLGQRAEQARRMADYYNQIGALPASLQQLQQARSATTDFYEQSVLDARIADMQRRIEDDRALSRQFQKQMG